MRFPDQATIYRSTGPDEYANPASDPEVASSASSRAFFVTADLIIFPADVVVSRRDRIRCRGRLLVADEVEEIRSPAKTVIWTVRVKEVPE